MTEELIEITCGRAIVGSVDFRWPPGWEGVDRRATWDMNFLKIVSRPECKVRCANGMTLKSPSHVLRLVRCCVNRNGVGFGFYLRIAHLLLSDRSRFGGMCEVTVATIDRSRQYLPPTNAAAALVCFVAILVGTDFFLFVICPPKMRMRHRFRF